MKSREIGWIVLAWIGLLSISGGNLWAGPFSEFKPLWKVGQTWKVEVTKESEPPMLGVRPESLPPFVPQKFVSTYKFTVEGMREVDGETCYQIRVQTVRIDDLVTTSTTYRGRLEFHRLYFRKNDLTLKCLERIRREHGNPDDILDNSRKFERMPVALSVTTMDIPMYCPMFDAEHDSYDASKDSPLVRNKTPIRRGNEANQRCRVMNETINGKEERVLRVELDDKDSLDRPKTPVVQVWRKGMPWCVREEREYHGVRLPARLVEVDGKPVSP